MSSPILSTNALPSIESNQQTFCSVFPTKSSTEISNSTKIAGKSSKITVLLKAAGNAPILKTKKWEVDETWTIAYFQQSLRKILKLTLDQSLFIFVNQSFSPSPEHTIGTLQQCFGGECSKLTLHYSTTLAWG